MSHVTAADSAPEPFSIQLDGISIGWIRATLRAGTDELTLYLDDISVWPDELADWAGAARAGSKASLGFGHPPSIGSFWLVAEPLSTGRTRVSASIAATHDVPAKSIDAVVSTTDLVSGVESFLRNILRHPGFMSAWYYCGIVEDALDDEADVEAAAATAAGIISDDFHAQEDFVALYIAERRIFTEEQSAHFAKYKAELELAADGLVAKIPAVTDHAGTATPASE